MNVSSKTFCISGADYSRDLLRTLDKGDQVLAENDGKQIKQAWTVVSNSPETIVLSRNNTFLRLLYSDLIYDSPAVFCNRKNHFVILKFIAYKTDSRIADAAGFLNEDILREICETLEDETLRVGLFENVTKAISTFSLTGWEYKSINRFALRAGVHKNLIMAFCKGDWDIMLKASDREVQSIFRELWYLPSLIKHSDLIQHDTLTLKQSNWKGQQVGK